MRLLLSLKVILFTMPSDLLAVHQVVLQWCRGFWTHTHAGLSLIPAPKLKWVQILSSQSVVNHLCPAAEDSWVVLSGNK